MPPNTLESRRLLARESRHRDGAKPFFASAQTPRNKSMVRSLETFDNHRLSSGAIVAADARTGRPLDCGEAELARSLAFDFAKVRVCDDANAAMVADRLSALAFTSGNQVVLGARYRRLDPVARCGVLLHELIHVAQNAHTLSPCGLSHAGDPAERAVNTSLSRVAANPGRRTTVNPVPLAAINRQELSDLGTLSHDPKILHRSSG